jgi:hypothetical protein
MVGERLELLRARAEELATVQTCGLDGVDAVVLDEFQQMKRPLLFTRGNA